MPIDCNAGKRGWLSVEESHASIWYSAAIGMALGFNYHVIALASALYAIMISRLPRLGRKEEESSSAPRAVEEQTGEKGPGK